MFLKRLDVVGFKSFAERLSIEFVPGVTAVVGPNGSGKSNITDAIRWVLGEQSAKSLRGAKMEDIIFAGSDSRKPLNFAEVTLTLDNEDQSLPIEYNEVSVTRRVYRSGESDFLINKQSCRLKDIVDLFMDSGLGREAFSIISQGKVEEILNSKAEDRRTIFEEAAGVLKYKTRKKKAESKLEETQENLNRVNDIIFELEGQVEPLKIQASLAKEYIEQKEELEQYEVALTVYEIEEMHKRWEHLQQQLQVHQGQELELTSNLAKREAKLEEWRDQTVALDESINSLQSALLHASEELEKLEGRKEVLKERKKNASQNKHQLEKSITEMTEKVELLASEKESLQEQVILFQEEVKTLNKHLTEKQSQIKLIDENIEETIESLKSEYIELLNKEAASKNEIQYIEQQLNQIAYKSERLDTDNSKFLNERNQLLQKKEQVVGKVEETSQILETHIHNFRSEEKRLEQLKGTIQKQESTLYQALQFLQQAKSKKEMLEAMEDEFAGFFQGVKEILKARDQHLSGIEGAVAELIQVKKTYDVAIETALGGASQHVVVDTEEHARSAIQFLKKNAYGRATFLPLTVIKGRNIAEVQLQGIKGHPAFVGVASDLVDYNPKYSAIITNLLGTVIVTKDLKGANEIAKVLQYRFRIVTIDGDVVNPGGSMTGGALKQKTTSILSRKGELEDLKEKLVVMEEKTTMMQNDVKQLKHDISTKEHTLQQLRAQGEELRFEEQSARSQLRELEIQEKNLNDRLALYDIEKKQFSSEQQELKEKALNSDQKLIQFKKLLQELDEQIQQLTKKRQTNQSSKETLSEEIAELKVLLAQKSEQLKSKKEQLEKISEDDRLTKEKKQEVEEDLHWLVNEMSSNTSGEEQLEEAAKRKLHDKQETTKLISERRDERSQLTLKVEDIELEVKELKRQIRGMTETLKDEEVKLNRLDVELENRLDHLREEYLLSFEAAKEQYPLNLPADEAKKKVKLIKMAIEELGTVNLGAIDEYARVSERYDFLLEQKTDLQEAKDTLFQVIEEMDEEMKKRFEQSFYAIRSHFESVFQALFGGGRADLRLTDPSDLLNTGVEIVAQPPGKKLQNLGLLSGGERALTAIALLFAILKVRPVPFCILDEVEAALDEANVHRFSQYLKRFSKETQFIVITHRKGTMEEADVLYGVTMQESGVSKLVSVRLEESVEFVN